MAKRQTLGKRNKAPALLTAVLIVMLIGIAIGVGAFALSLVRGMLANPGVLPGLPSSTQPSENVTYKFGEMLPTWSGTERVTVLLLGIDERTQENGPFRTDTMMLMTLDPVSKTGGAMSIPRDLWVPIPGYKDGRINTAHFLGDLYGYTGGGPALARETVEYNIGEPIHHYVRVNFEGFVEFVDLIGGVDIYVEEAINDFTYPDYNYGYDPFQVAAGWHHFDGETALKYARTRHGSTDFARSRRQQQVMLAMLDQVTKLNLLPQLAKNTPELYALLERAVQTDFALDQILALGNLVLQVERENIRFGTIDSTCTQPWVTPEGAQVLIPLRAEMRAMRDYIFFADFPTPVPQVAGSTAVPAPTLTLPSPTPEVAVISLLNGTTTAGLASSTADYLKTHSLNIGAIGNAETQNYAKSLIILNRDKPGTATRIVDLLQLPSQAIVHGTDANAEHDIVVILGSDYAGPPQ